MRRYCVAGLSLSGLMAVATAFLWAMNIQSTGAHCQVPCGIYDDSARIVRLQEDATTIAKAVDQIGDLSGKRDAQSVNQSVRWITTKENHASHIIEVVAEYFLAQRVKPVMSGADGHQSYLKKLADHHAVIIAAMKAKQNADASHVDRLRNAIDAMAVHYKK